MARIGGRTVAAMTLAGRPVLRGDHGGAVVYRGLTRWRRYNAVSISRSIYYLSSWVPDLSIEIGEVLTGWSGYSLNEQTGQLSPAGQLRSITVGQQLGTLYSLSASRVGRWSCGRDGCLLAIATVLGPAVSISYVRGSVDYGPVYGKEGTYPTNGRGQDGYWYVLEQL